MKIDAAQVTVSYMGKNWLFSVWHYFGWGTPLQLKWNVYYEMRGTKVFWKCNSISNSWDLLQYGYHSNHFFIMIWKLYMAISIVYAKA